MIVVRFGEPKPDEGKLASNRAVHAIPERALQKSPPFVAVDSLHGVDQRDEFLSELLKRKDEAIAKLVAVFWYMESS